MLGDLTSAGALCDKLPEGLDSGFEVNDVCILGDEGSGTGGRPRTAVPDMVAGFPVLGDLTNILAATERSGSSAVAVATSPLFGRDRLPDLAWSFKGTGVRLLVEPDSVGGTEPRPDNGLPLLPVGEPRLSGRQRVVNGAVDLSVAVFGLLLLSPVLLAAAVMILLATAARSCVTRITSAVREKSSRAGPSVARRTGPGASRGGRRNFG